MYSRNLVRIPPWLHPGYTLADLVKKYLARDRITFDGKARVPAWNFDNSRAVIEFIWQIQSVAQEDEILV